MKRKSANASSEVSSKRAPRQDPVSCELCRRKKLKCNRQQPCSNCATRRLNCSYGGGSSQPTGIQTKEASDGHHENQQDETSTFSTTVQASRDKNESLVTADWLEKILMGDRVLTGCPASHEASSQSHNSSISGPEMVGQGLSILRLGQTPSSENPATIRLVNFLPKETEAMALFHYYIDYIDYLYHIILPQRVQEQIHGVYQAIERHKPPNLSHLALVFSILASSLFPQLSIQSSANAEACCREYTFLTGAGLIQNNHSMYPTIEGLQATMIVAHHLPNMSTHPSVCALFVHGAIVSQAKNLMLHCIDSPRMQEERKTNGCDMVEVELKRRLWWDIASYDWLLAYLSGPQECTYLIRQDQMNVREPANMDDEIPDTMENYNSSPTKMSYALQRLKLARTCRVIVDTTAYDHLRGKEVSYDTILGLDRFLHSVCNELPDFFHLDPTSRRQYASLYQERPALAWQRCLLHQGIHSRLCRLHRQHLIRGARDPTYSYSHVVCLQSARKVIEIKRIMDEDEPAFMPPSSVVWSVMHHVFMAAVILLMDVCFNWDDILAERRKEEVLDACRMLSKAQQSSSTVREGIDALMGVLQRHWKSGQPSSVIDPVVIEGLPGSTPMSAANVKQASIDLPSMHDSGERQLEDLWTEMLDSSGSFSYDTPDWTGLLTDLTNATVPYG